MPKFSFMIAGDIELPEGAHLSTERPDIVILADGTQLEFDVNLEPHAVIDENDIAYNISFRTNITQPFASSVASLVKSDPSVIAENGTTSSSSLDAFVSMISSVKKSSKATTSLYHLLLEATAALPLIQYNEEGEDLLYSPEEIAELSQRYQEVDRFLTIMREKHFEIFKLEMMCYNGNCAVVFRYRTPKGSNHTKEYIRAQDAENVIPNDFLHDLEHIPNRH